MIHKLLKFWPIILLIVITFILRAVNLEELFYFTYDESIPAFVGRRLILWHHIPLIGGVTPFNFHLGPYFYWFYSLGRKPIHALVIYSQSAPFFFFPSFQPLPYYPNVFFGYFGRIRVWRFDTKTFWQKENIAGHICMYSDNVWSIFFWFKLQRHLWWQTMV